MVDPGPDGELGSGDDVPLLQPGQTGQAEFLVEGLQQGLQVMNLDLTADLHGLANGVVQVKGKAAGSVLVRNPKFSLTFTHPKTVRVGEPYTASITILNTGETPANLVSINLNKNSISGAVLDTNQDETIQLGTILPGQSGTATYRMVALRTGDVTFSDLTTGDDSVSGRFRFKMGVDAQGVPLSPDTIAMPDFVNYLPTNLVFAATRVLGQALSIATAANSLPGSLHSRSPSLRGACSTSPKPASGCNMAIRSARAGGLLRDWQGGRAADDAFDALLRTSDAGAAWRSALFAAMETADGLDGTERLVDRAPDLTGLGQQFVIASASGTGVPPVRLEVSDGQDANATTESSTLPYSLVYAGTNGEWAVTPFLTNAVFTWSFTNNLQAGRLCHGRHGGSPGEHQWSGGTTSLAGQQSAGGLPSIISLLMILSHSLLADLDGDGIADSTIQPSMIQRSRNRRRH